MSGTPACSCGRLVRVRKTESVAPKRGQPRTLRERPGQRDAGSVRVRASLSKYSIPFDESLSDEELRTLLAGFYAKRTLTHQPIDPVDCAEAILFLAGERSRCTSGHLIPVDGGLPEAFFR